jgi:hypothetical protein
MTFKVEKSWVTQAGSPAVVIWANDSLLELFDGLVPALGDT